MANWPALGGMGNASWTQLSGHWAPGSDFESIRWRLDVWNASAQVSSDVSRRGRRPALLVFADSLAYYGPTGGLPADDPVSGPILLLPN